MRLASDMAWGSSISHPVGPSSSVTVCGHKDMPVQAHLPSVLDPRLRSSTRLLPHCSRPQTSMWTAEQAHSPPLCWAELASTTPGHPRLKCPSPCSVTQATRIHGASVLCCCGGPGDPGDATNVPSSTVSVGVRVEVDQVQTSAALQSWTRRSPLLPILGPPRHTPSRSRSSPPAPATAPCLLQSLPSCSSQAAQFWLSPLPLQSLVSDRLPPHADRSPMTISSPSLSSGPHMLTESGHPNRDTSKTCPGIFCDPTWQPQQPPLPHHRASQSPGVFPSLEGDH